MIRGLRAITRSTSMPSLARASSRMFVMNTSASSINWSMRSRPCCWVRSSPMPRLFRFAASKYGFDFKPGRWIARIEREASPPCVVRSILMTSAPQSARIIAAAGTNVCSATSRTLTPLSTSYIVLLSDSFRWFRCAVRRPVRSRRTDAPTCQRTIGTGVALGERRRLDVDLMAPDLQVVRQRLQIPLADPLEDRG